MRGSQHLSGPEWTIVGARTSGGVMVIASSTLRHAELERVVDEMMAFGYDDPVAEIAHYELHTTMSDVVMVRADDYSAALKHLFAATDWSPTPAPQELPHG